MPRARRAARWTVVAGVILVVIAALYRGILRYATVSPDDGVRHLILPLFVVLIVVLALGFAGVLIRNLVRLIIERKKGILGSRLRTKLVFFFLAFVLLPAFVMFYGSAGVTRLTVDAMLRASVFDAMAAAQKVVDGWMESTRAECQRLSVRLAAELGRAADGKAGQASEREILRRWLLAEPLDAAAIVTGGTWSAIAVDPRVRDPQTFEAAIRPLAVDLAARALRNAETATRVDVVRGGLLVQAVAPVPTVSGRARSAVWVGAFLAPDLAERMAQVAAGAEDYRRLSGQRKELVRFYLALTALILLATVFVATWIGFYLSRRITVPVEQVAAAAREISAGNLGVRVRAEEGDEVGTLVDAFNEMAAQLQESREVIVRSTADLRRSNLALDERRRYIEALLANLSTAVVSLDGEGRVTTVNPASEGILKLRLAPGDFLRDRLRVPGLEPLADLVDRFDGRPGESRRHEIVLARPDGRVSLSVQITPLRGRTPRDDAGLLLMIEDLTDLLRAQRVAAWREVARRIAHEIKNPLTPIQLAAQRVRKKLAERSPDFPAVVEEATSSIEREVGALKDLVDEFSRFARMPEIFPRPTDFREVLEAAVSLYRAVPDVHITTAVPDELGPVTVDPEAMRRVLINLIDNAVEAAAGPVRVAIAVGHLGGGGSLRLEVADDGPGIEAADRDRLFLPYFSTKRRGTGLGLAIVHRVVTDHGGTIRIEDAAPRGARFVIEIPG